MKKTNSKLKKLTALALTVLLVLTILTGCGGSEADVPETTEFCYICTAFT